MTNRPPSPLPPLLQRALTDEPAEEQAALAQTWALLEHVRPAEPSTDAFSALGTEIWSALDAELMREPVPLPDAVQHALTDEPTDEQAALTRTWSLADEARAAEPADAFFAALGAKIWAVLHAEISRTVPQDRAAVRRPRRTSRRVWAPVFAVALLLVVAGQWYRAQPLSTTTAAGETTLLTLADGSTVELNSGSTLHYPRTFSDERTVELDGEAYFDVVHDPARPFRVQTFNAQVEVLGTAFNVRARSGDADAETTVALYEGAVRVEHTSTQTTTPLAPGQRITLGEASAGPVTPFALDEIRPDWQLGRFTLTNRPLSTIIAEAERRFSVTIELSPTLGDEALTLTHTTDDVSALLADIVAMKGLTLETTATGYRLSRP
ncbi:MAG: FecR domain-containing protein [Bacteroidota bacterium]